MQINLYFPNSNKRFYVSMGFACFLATRRCEFKFIFISKINNKDLTREFSITIKHELSDKLKCSVKEAVQIEEIN